MGICKKPLVPNRSWICDLVLDQIRLFFFALEPLLPSQRRLFQGFSSPPSLSDPLSVLLYSQQFSARERRRKDRRDDRALLNFFFPPFVPSRSRRSASLYGNPRLEQSPVNLERLERTKDAQSLRKLRFAGAEQSL